MSESEAPILSGPATSVPRVVNPEVLIVPEGYEAHWRPDLSDADYHADKTAVNSSSLKRMLKSPNAFYDSFFVAPSKPSTAAQKFGSLAHAAILQGRIFREKYVIKPEFVGLTKDGRPSNRSASAKEKEAAWLAEQPADAIICTEQEREQLLASVDSLLSHEQAFKLLKDGLPEVAGYYRHPETGVLCRFKPDHLSFAVHVLVDLKTCEDAEWTKFRRSVEGYRYDFQMEMYADGVYRVSNRPLDGKVWIALERERPYEVACYEVPPQYEATGRHDYTAVMRRLKSCIDERKWPQRQLEIEYGEPSPWFFKDYELKGAFSELQL